MIFFTFTAVEISVTSGLEIPRVIKDFNPFASSTPVPTGQNPTGSSLPLERRQKIYELAAKHKVIIVEDEPYYFLQLGELTEGGSELKSESDKDFLASVVPSFSSMDTEGIVVRMDSLSKVLAPRLSSWMGHCTAICLRKT